MWRTNIGLSTVFVNVLQIIFFNRCTVHSDIHTVHSPNRWTFIKTLITIYITYMWLLQVSVYDHD